MVAVAGLSSEVGVVSACRLLTVPRATHHKAMSATTCSAEPSPRPTPARALTLKERAIVLETLNSERFCEMAPMYFVGPPPALCLGSIAFLV